MTRKPTSRIAVTALFFGAMLTLAAPVGATSLTFEMYSDAGKTTRVSDGGHSFQSYGDNVTDFSPAAAVGGMFVNYGSAGGVTPDVTVEYRYYNPTNLPDNGLSGENTYFSAPSDNFGDLPQVFYNGQGLVYYVEIRLIPSNGKTVTLESFDLAGYRSDRTVDSIEAIEDVNNSPVSLWGPLTNTVISGTAHNHFTPNVSVTDGHTLSLIYGADANGLRGISNIVFSTPEPASLSLLALGGVAMLSRRKR